MIWLWLAVERIELLYPANTPLNSWVVCTTWHHMPALQRPATVCIEVTSILSTQQCLASKTVIIPPNHLVTGGSRCIHGSVGFRAYKEYCSIARDTPT